MKRLLLGVSMAAVLALGPLAWAQSVVTPTSQTQATTPTTDPAALAVSDTVKVPVRALVETELPSEPLPVSFGLGSSVIEGIDPALTAGVTFEGYARKVEVPVTDGTTKIGQVLVMSVAKDDRVEQIDAQGLTAQFEADTDSLFPDKPVEVEGNRAALIAALQRLAGEETTEEEKTKVEAENGGAGTDGSDGAASNAAQNEDLANYQAPDVETTPEEEPVISINLTTEGCQVRVDEAQGVAIQQSRTETLEDGVVTDKGSCSDGDKRYPLQKSYAACPDSVSVATLTATANYQSYYVDDGGTSHTVGDCQPDSDASFAITESADGCTNSIDLNAGTVTVNTALVYSDRNGKQVQVRGCQPSSTKASISLTKTFGQCADKVNLAAKVVYPQYVQTYKDANGSSHTVSDCTPDIEQAKAITEDTKACSMRVDLASGQVIPQAALVYTNSAGQSVQVRGCQDAENSSPVTLTRNYEACSDLVSLSALTVTPQYQETYTEKDGSTVSVSSCTPDAAKAVAIEKSYDACADKVDTTAGTASRQYQLTYTDEDGVRQPLSECRTDAESAVALVKNYDACADVVNLDSLTATRQYQLSYTDSKGVDHAVSKCQPDSAAVFTIAEDTSSCPVKIDLVNGQAIPQAVLSYVDAKGKTVQVRGCAASVETAAVPLIKSYQACTDVVDVAALTATRRYQLTYTDQDGSQQTVSECQPDSEAVFQITEDPASCPVKIDLASGQAIPQAVLSYEDANGKSVQVRGCGPASASSAIALEKSYGACSDLIDLDALTATPRYQMTYTADGTTQVVSDCTADPSAVISITQDTKACDMAVDLDALTAKPQAILTYTDRSGKEVQVRGCAPLAGAQAVALTQNYDACTVEVDLPNGIAFPRYNLTYKDSAGLAHTVSDCTPDEDKAMQVIEKVADCPVDVDLDAKTATVQGVLSYTTEEGEEIQVRGCSPTAQVLPISKSYGQCADKVDLDTLTAWPMFQWSYINSKGVLTTVTDCTVDQETTFPISENTAACPVSVEVPNKRAVVQGVLTYQDRSGKTVQARDCQPSQTVAPLPMAQDASSCPLRHDFDAGQTDELGMWVYTLGGQAYQATPCLPTGRSFTHSTVTSANGAYVCAPVIVGSSVTIQGRKQITVDGIKRFISECAPVDSASQTLQATTDGCMDISAWTHDIAGTVSYGQERFYYLKPNGQRDYVSDCQTSSTIYPHSHTPVSWDYHDDALFAYRLYTISIEVNNVDQVIAVGQLLPGASQVPYVEYGVTNQGTGEYSYESCTKYEQTEQVTAYTRPDGTTYSKPIGPGPLTNLGDVCTYIRPDSVEAWVPQFVMGTRDLFKCPFEGTRTVIREDGAVVSKTTANKNLSPTQSPECATAMQIGCSRICANSPTSGDVNGWLLELGW